MMNKYKAVYDISIWLGAESFDYPGHPPFSREPIGRAGDSGALELSRLAMSAHAGTHLDFPAHFIAGGKHIDDYPIQRFILPAQVVSIEDKEAIRPSELENLDIKPGDALLFKTDNSLSGRCTSGVFSKSFVYMSPEAADFCVDKKVSLVGIDYGSIDRYDTQDFPAHHKLLGNDILILETINLREVPPGRYTLFCLPLKIKGAEGSPARAVLVS
jgi:arylformamidase